jgi:uridine kinase
MEEKLNKSQIYLIGICGGSGSGKTTFAQRVHQQLGSEKTKILYQDNYYKDQSKKFDHDGGAVNFDHPSAIDFELLAEHLKFLKQNKPIQVPVYDFVTHTRAKDYIHFGPTQIILLDGTLILNQEKIHQILDFSFYIKTDEDTRFDRRFKRDTIERGRSPEGVKNQFYRQVKPMHDQFVEPSQNNAHYIVEQNSFQDFVDQFCRWGKE